MDLFDKYNQEAEGTTRAIPPVEPADVKPARRRRTERFAGLIDEEDNVNVEELPAAPQEAPAPVEPPVVIPAPEGETRSQPRVQQPSQGVPRPAALSGQRPRREQQGQTVNTPVVRRPVNAEGYAPLQQLGEHPRARRPEPVSPLDTPRRIRTPETERIAYENLPEEEEKGPNRGLIAVIIVLLVVAALIVGLLMIPNDDPGVLGSIKRTVTAPIAALFDGGDEADKTPAATASDFTATISQNTAPYKVAFQMVTSSGVTGVRVVDENGNVIPTVMTHTLPNTESTIVWKFEMTLEDSFEGNVQAQIQSGESWVDTGLWQMLTLGGETPATVSSVPVTAPPAATPTATPTVAPVITIVEESAAPHITPAPVIEDVTLLATATPTLSVTATPTLVPTTAPTVEPTEAPTPEPTAEPTPEPTATPEPTPEATPLLEALADDSADPALISTTVIYKDDRKVTGYERKEPINMPAADDYMLQPYGVMTFRGNAFRQNAATGTVENPTSLSLEWTVEAGSVAGSSRNYYGIGWTGQPVIVRWPSDIRKSMDLEQIRKDQKNLKEVIIAGMDGKIYFLDLLDGSATRDAIDFGYPMRSTPSVHPLFYPMMTVGQYARKLKTGTSKEIGLYYYNLMDQKELRMIDGIDRKYERPYNAVGAFDTSALIYSDTVNKTHTLIAIGTNGMLYTEKMEMDLHLDKDTGLLEYEFKEPDEVVMMMSHTKGQNDSYAAVESSLAMYGSYAYYADLEGVLRCVDTTTMTTAWAVDTGDAVRAAIALDLEEGDGTNTLWLYTANLVNTGRTKGNVTIRRFNAMTGEEDWAFAIHCADTKKKDVTFNATITPGAMASPVIGQQGLGDLVYFTLSSVSATGAAELEEGAAIPGVIIALDKATGKVAWHKAMEAYCYSSPVAVYDENGKGWIIQACSNGTIYLMDGLTGSVINTLQVNGVIEGSPAVYGDTLVIGTTGKGASYIYGIKIN